MLLQISFVLGEQVQGRAAIWANVLSPGLDSSSARCCATQARRYLGFAQFDRELAIALDRCRKYGTLWRDIQTCPLLTNIWRAITRVNDLADAARSKDVTVNALIVNSRDV
jgi:hypothetical protein